MRYHALATDYDGTLAEHGDVSDATLDALRRLRGSGRELILVTGRELPDLLRVFAHPEVFDSIVAENGALLYDPATKKERVLAKAPPRTFADRLREIGVWPLSVGRVIVATGEPNERVVLEVIRDLGLELQVIFNKGAVMVLPSGVNKATGLSAALRELGLSAHNTVGVGDAENDHAFLARCECAVAVANALSALKDRADVVTRNDHGAGVCELIEQLLTDDLRSFADRLSRHDLLLGCRKDRREVRFRTHGSNVLVAGSGGTGKSTMVRGVLEDLIQKGYQACIVDGKGVYLDLDRAVLLGTTGHAPPVEGVLQALDQPKENVIVSLAGVDPADRTSYFKRLLPELVALRAKTGRPHWIVLDQAEDLLPGSAAPEAALLPEDLTNMLVVADHPGALATFALREMELVVATGTGASERLTEFCHATGRTDPELPEFIGEDESLGWECSAGQPFLFTPVIPTKTEQLLGTSPAI